MSLPDSATALHISAPSRPAGRRREPVTAGIPLEPGLVHDATHVGVLAADGTPLPVQAAIMERWPDGSARWILLDLQIDRTPDLIIARRLDTGVTPPLPDAPVVVEETVNGVRVQIGTTVFGFAIDGAFPISTVTCHNRPFLDANNSGLRLSIGADTIRYSIERLSIERRGPLRAELHVHAAPTDRRADAPTAWARIDLHAGSATVRCDVTLHNPRRAIHPGGQWGLGDPGSLLIESADIRLAPTAAITGVACALERDVALEPCALPLRVHQESSGGANWQAAIHRNRHGVVPLRYQGYEFRTGDRVTRGQRATPTVVASTAEGSLTLTVPQFWERFPQAVTVDTAGVMVGLLPALDREFHELQGGEQTTRTFVFVCGTGNDASSLAWCHEPIVLTRSPDAACRNAGIPCLLPASDEPSPGYLALVALALDEHRGFVAKRERADEYGWRNFGDMPADHESAFQSPDAPFVSHYNNQYDPIAGFALHFLRTGDRRWWQLMTDLATHVRDIDIYRTTQDKAVYNGGLFWHTNHYVDAGLSTHRTYPAGGSAGGGPSAEHNYNFGFMLHYFLTGDTRSRDVAIALGQWVLDMDDGRLTPLRWLSRDPTGWASYTAGHHEAGRGAGHSILACVVAHRLSGDRRFLDKAEAIIRRCVTPQRDVSQVFVDNVEGYWSYTAFLQALGVYLDHKIAIGQRDAMAGWARGALLAFARFMADHERPYLDRRERLQFPTQTWAAQDLRKADVFQWAALHADGDERQRFLERADLFFDYAVNELPRLDGFWFTRPLVLVLTQGVRHGWFVRQRDQLPPPVVLEPAPATARRRRFVSQRARALRRLTAIGAATGAAAATAIWRLLS